MNDVAQLAGPIMTAAHPGSLGAATSPVLSAGAPGSVSALPRFYNLQAVLQGKDSSWLQLEVCREFQRNRCTRTDADCRYAHPPAHVEVNVGRVTACYDSIKGRCTRENPPCKYFHPPHHLRDQLLNNGKSALAVKNMIISQFAYSGSQQGVAAVPTIMQNNKAAIHSVLPPALSYYDPTTLAGASPYLTGAIGTYGLMPGTPLMPLTLGHDAATLNMMAAAAAGAPQTLVTGSHMLQNPQKAGRQDGRVDGYSGGIPGSLPTASAVAAAAAAAAAASSPYKRVATGDKTGVTMYQQHPQAQTAAGHHQQQQNQQQTQQQQQSQAQHSQQQAAAAAAAYQQAVALMSLQPPFVPVTWGGNGAVNEIFVGKTVDCCCYFGGDGAVVAPCGGCALAGLGLGLGFGLDDATTLNHHNNHNHQCTPSPSSSCFTHAAPPSSMTSALTSTTASPSSNASSNHNNAAAGTPPAMNHPDNLNHHNNWPQHSCWTGSGFAEILNCATAVAEEPGASSYMY